MIGVSANLSAVVGGGERDYAKQLWTEVESTYRGAVRGNTLQRRLSGNGGGERMVTGSTCCSIGSCSQIM